MMLVYDGLAYVVYWMIAVDLVAELVACMAMEWRLSGNGDGNGNGHCIPDGTE